MPVLSEPDTLPALAARIVELERVVAVLLALQPGEVALPATHVPGGVGMEVEVGTAKGGFVRVTIHPKE